MNARRYTQWAAIVIGFLALSVSLSYLARTRPFVGNSVSKRIEAEARKRNLDIEVGNIQPYGLWGLSLIDVSVRVPKDSIAVEAQFERINVTPSLSALFEDRVEIDEIDVEGGVISVVTGEFSRPPRPEPEPRTGKTSSKPKKTKKRPPLAITLHDVRFRGPLRGSSALSLTRVSFKLDGRTASQFSGYGTFPDGTKFGMRTEIVDGNERIELTPDGRTHVEDWMGGDIPLKLTTSGFVICPSCEKNQFLVRDVELTAPDWTAARLTAPSAQLTREGSSIIFETLEMALDSQAAEAFGARISRPKFVIDTNSGELSGRFGIAAVAGGKLSVDWTFTEEFDFTFFAEEFELGSVWNTLEIDLPITPGRVNGSLRCLVSPTTRVIELESAMMLESVIVDVAKLSAKPLNMRKVRVTGHAVLDIPGRALSVSRGRIRLDASDPVDFKGQIVDAVDGWSFFGHIEAKKLNVLTFKDGLPPELTWVVDGALMDGNLGFWLTVGGHSAFGESLHLAGELTGNVRVQRDSPQADVLSLNTNGAPPMLENARLENWRSYDQLPPIVPTVMLAAEDASFFRHPGFDWDGFKRAMVHNLESGSLRRGGSTISQQVVKNLFLSHERSLTRKLQEAYLTWRMEDEVPKERILEIYINIVEWGGGAQGIAQASRRYFDAEPSELAVEELAMLASILPNPHRFGGAIKDGRLPSSRMHKIGRILKNLSFMGKIGYGEYKRAFDRSLSGRIGRLNLTVCDDDGSVKDAKSCY